MINTAYFLLHSIARDIENVKRILCVEKFKTLFLCIISSYILEIKLCVFLCIYYIIIFIVFIIFFIFIAFNTYLLPLIYNIYCI